MAVVKWDVLFLSGLSTSKFNLDLCWHCEMWLNCYHKSDYDVHLSPCELMSDSLPS